MCHRRGASHRRPRDRHQRLWCPGRGRAYKPGSSRRPPARAHPGAGTPPLPWPEAAARQTWCSVTRPRRPCVSAQGQVRARSNAATTLHVPNPWTGFWVKGRVGARAVRAHNTQHAFSLISYSARAQARSPAWPFSVSELARASAVDISSAECRSFSSMRRRVACMLWARSADHPSSAATPFQKDAVKGPPRRRPSECDALRTPGRPTPMGISEPGGRPTVCRALGCCVSERGRVWR